MIKRPRVVITGMGVLAANGIGIPAFWDSIVHGRSGIGPITLFDAKDQFLRIAGEIKHFKLNEFVDMPIKAKRLGRHTQFALAATHMALADAKLTKEILLHAGKVPINLGVSTCAMELIEDGMHHLFDHGPSRFSPYIVSYALPHGITHALCEHLGISSDGKTISSACQSGAEAIATAFKTMCAGETQIAIAGGADAPLTPFTVAAFCSGGLRPESYDESKPQSASRPFDLKRTGGILAEGAGVLILERREHAIARGAHIYAEIKGCFTCSDEPNSIPTSGLEITMKTALINAGLFPEDIQYISAHGPSEPIMDKEETRAIKSVFGPHAYRVPVSSIKGVTGNALSAQGPMQAISTAMAIHCGIIPPTANLDHPDPECDLDYIPNKYRAINVKNALVNAHGLGGGNTCMVLSAAK